MPEVQRQFNQLHGEIKTANVTVTEWFTRLNERFDMMESSRGDLAVRLVELGNRLGGAGSCGGWRRPLLVVEGILGDVDAEIEQDEDFEKASKHLIRIRDIDCVDHIYFEFKGIGRLFQGKPIDGGLEACDVRWKAKWRKHFNLADQKHFSWMAMLGKAIDKEVCEGVPLGDVLARFDTYFRQNKRRFCTLIDQLQLEGFIEKKAFGRKRQRESPGEGGGGG
jgi:hypothetical protein